MTNRGWAFNERRCKYCKHWQQVKSDDMPDTGICKSDKMIPGYSFPVKWKSKEIIKKFGRDILVFGGGYGYGDEYIYTMADFGCTHFTTSE